MKVEEYLAYLSAVRHYSPETLRAYRNDLRLFEEFLKDEQLDYISLEPPCARRFIASLSEAGMSVNTVNRVLSGMKSYYRYLMSANVVDANPFTNLHGLRKKRELPDYLFENEIEVLLSLTDDNFAGLRDRLILELLYSTGCRVSEAAAVNLQHIDFRNGSLRVLGKGGKERIVFLGTSALNALKDYIPLRKIRTDKDDPDAAGALLLNQRGRRITQRGIAMIIEKYVRKSGIAKKVSPHTFRHSFATHLIDHGADIRIVQEMLGHESLSTTQIYTHMGIEKLRDVYKRAHPHAEIRKTGVKR